ncbi:hypothetical protein ACIPPQ_08475 [Sphingopyxis sp. LARHCG72]
MRLTCAASMLLAVPGAAMATGPEAAARHFTESEIAAIEMPALAFRPTAQDAGTYDKYYYFHRDATSFDQAFADISECDALASGISYYRGGSEPYPGYYATQYGMGGVIGGVIGEMLADAIFGSSERRKVRRINMRNCMGFKGYVRYGLSKELWETFNFEEGSGREDEATRNAALLKQARVASGEKPQQAAIEL